jgi:hypothetical protein
MGSASSSAPATNVIWTRTTEIKSYIPFTRKLLAR